MSQDKSRNEPTISIHGNALIVKDSSGAPLNLNDLIESSAHNPELALTINTVMGAVADLALHRLKAYAKRHSDDVGTAWKCADWLAGLLPIMESCKISLPEDLAVKVEGVLTQTRKNEALRPLLETNPHVFANSPKFPELR